MDRISFYGATGTVTGSRFLLEIQDRKFLIDCGLFQGPKELRLKNWDPFPVSPADIDMVLLTHAHIDHSGYLPRFCADGFQGIIACTDATYDLCEIMLKDSAYLQEEDARWANKKGFSKHKPAKPLYDTADAEKALTYFSPLHYGEDSYVGDDLRLKFKDAGHILGSSIVDIKTVNGADSRKIVFSGDLGRPNSLLLRDPAQVYDVDYLVLESTYGQRLHDDRPVDLELARVINESVERKGVLVIPSFAVGRTQALLYMIRELEEKGKIPSLPVYVDSPMAIDAMEIFKRRIVDQNMTGRALTLTGKKIFQPRELHLCKSRDDSKAINQVKNPAIIVSASGMVTGGRILHHLQNRLPHKENTVLFIGYQAEGTRGRAILDGSEYIKIHGRQVPVKAKIEMITGFSAHADYNEILAWLMAFNHPPEKTFLVHGEPQAAVSLAEKIRQHFGWDVVIPEYGQSFKLKF